MIAVLCRGQVFKRVIFGKIRLVTLTALQFLDPTVFQAQKVQFIKDFFVFFRRHSPV